VTITAPAGTGDGNIREVFWPSSLGRTSRGETCATWASASSPLAQEGVALDIRQDGDDVSALVVSVNVEYGVRWTFNVHYMDSADEASPFTLLGQWDFSKELTSSGVVDPFPWRACARVDGSTLEFKVWLPGRSSEPGWGDPRYSRSLNGIPRAYLAAGVPGWYAGHIPPGANVVYGALVAQTS
jgi:hypothetical protein